MATLIILLSVLAAAHFIYEGIIAPSLRDALRNEMFELRDRLRVIRMDPRSECPAEAFDIAHNGIDQYINRLHWINLSFVVAFNRAHRRAELRSEVKRRRDVLANCGVDELSKVVQRGNKVVEAAFFVNSFALSVLVMPIALVLIAVTALPKKMYAKASELFAAPGRSTETVLASSSYAM